MILMRRKNDSGRMFSNSNWKLRRTLGLSPLHWSVPFTYMGFWGSTVRNYIYLVFTGAMDGKHVRIKCPLNSGTMFFNYKRFFSVVLQAVADSHCRSDHMGSKVTEVYLKLVCWINSCRILLTSPRKCHWKYEYALVHSVIFYCRWHVLSAVEYDKAMFASRFNKSRTCS